MALDVLYNSTRQRKVIFVEFIVSFNQQVAVDSTLLLLSSQKIRSLGIY